MSAGSKTNPGGYTSAPESLEQFEIDDDRTPAEVAAFLSSEGYTPVWKDWDATYDGQRRTGILHQSQANHVAAADVAVAHARPVA